MGRNISPKFRLSRREGTDLFPDLDKAGTAKSPLMRRNYRPGMHGQKFMRGKASNYGRQLREKQKAKSIYGLLERQFQNYYKNAIRHAGDTGEVMLLFLEKRLDNVVYRLGFAKTRAAARQLVNHRLVLVDGKRVDIPSFQVKVGQVISLKEKLTKKETFSQGVKSLDRTAPDWLKRENWQGKVLADPSASGLQEAIDMRQIVEFYSR